MVARFRGWFGDDDFRQMCVSLAEHGYYAMFVEYFSRAGQPNCREYAMDQTYNRAGPTTVIPDNPWEWSIVSAGSSLANNPKADATRFGLVGFSFGGMLAVRTGLV
jgi:dienelactone hydrolase